MDRSLITGIVLAGGRGSRMGGVDKGLQLYNGTALAKHATQQLQSQVGPLLINANRNLDTYEMWGSKVSADVLVDGITDFAGPLAGFLVGLQHCKTPYLMTVPCDTPRFPSDLVSRLANALSQQDADIAMVSSPDEEGVLRHQPVFCLMKRELVESLKVFTDTGGRKIGAWVVQHKLARVNFNEAHDDPKAFYNANTLEDLQQLSAYEKY
ncbi:MAG: putative molybdopterin-guanine dinucleotide biosynthesis protein [Pseudomonadota bacterium]